MRALARWGITPLLAAPVGAWALGLGDIELESGLNQPFRARIGLSATADELQGLRIALAGSDTFARYGLDRPAFFNSFQFRVTAAPNGAHSISVTSAESIAEPFVTLLLEATWPRGRTLREYTVLLDPPVLLPAPASPPAVRPAETRQPSSSSPGGQINRPAPATPASPPAPAPSPERPPAISSTPVPAPREPVELGGTYGPVQPAETLWGIAERLRPAGTSTNQMMIAVYEANPEAFGGNINLLRAGATLRLPDAAALQALAVTAANAEVQRQADAWRDRASATPQQRQLRLLPPSETVAATPPAQAAPAPAPAAPAAEPAASAADGGAAAAAAAAAAEESRRVLELRNAELQRLQEQAAAPAAEATPAEAAEPGVELESEQLFADETPEPAAAEVEAPPAQPAPAPAPVAQTQSSESSLFGWLLSPILWIGLGVAALLFSALWFVRRRRQEVQDVTGRWEALESDNDDDTVSRDATERLRRAVPEQTIVVEEQHAEAVRPPKPEPAPAVARTAGARASRTGTPDETLSSQTVINLDQADAIAEADFHIAYGLYDQAAELVQKALDAAPGRRDLKLKLLEVFFMWGNKEAFLKAAEDLRTDIGAAGDSDWDKVVIMGRQICPDERLFTEATTGAGSVDVDLEAGDSPLDLAFEDGTSVEQPVVSAVADELDFNFEADDTPAPPPRPAARPMPPRDYSDDSLDIGAKTAAGLEAALFEPESDDEDTGRRTTPDVAAVDSLAVTQESPTIERPRSSDWATVDSSGLQYAADAPTVETPTIESPAARASENDATLAIPQRIEPPTVEQPSLASTGDFTAEIDLDDLGLDLKDIESLPSDLGDLPSAGDSETDTREQRALRADDALLSATGVTKVLDSDDDFMSSNTSVLEDEDATLLAPGFDDGTLAGTQVLEARQERDDETGSTSLVRSLRQDDGVDLDLEDLTVALHGSDTVEQPRSTSFSRDVFGGGDTPLDIDVGADIAVDDDPTGTEDLSPLDPQTMTEIGTKLDLARAYIDMGDPEGARSILEEVLDEGDNNQRREAQGLIDVLSA